MIVPEIEGEIAAKRAAGDLAGAASAAVRGYGPQILGYLRVTLAEPLVDDAFSGFCEALWKGLPGFRGQSSFLTWAYQVAWTAAQRVLASPHHRRAVQLSSTAMAAIAQEVRSTAPPHLRTEEHTRLTRIRAGLDAAEQTLLVLRVDRDLSWEDVAIVMDTDAATLRKRFERLKLKIKKLADDDRGVTS